MASEVTMSNTGKLKTYRSYRAKSKSPPKVKPRIDPFILIRKGEIDEIRSKIEGKEIDLQVTRWSGFTLLHRAAEIGHTELCEYLISSGIPVNTSSARGWLTPLHIALANGYLETAQRLVDLGANPWKKNKYNEDPFDYGSKRGFVKLCDEFRTKMQSIELKKQVEKHFAQSSTS